MLISHKSTFLIDCSGVVGPFWGLKLSLIVNFGNFLVVLHMKKFLNQWASFRPFFCASLTGNEESDACMSAIMHAHQKRNVLSAFFAFFVGEYWQPISNSDSHLFLSFLNRSNPIGFRKGFKQHMACHHQPLCVFWPRTTMVIDQGCCGGHNFSS